MSAGIIARAAGWFVLLLAAGLGLDGVDRYKRLTSLQADLVRAEHGASMAKAASDRTGEAPATMPAAADDGYALRPLRTMRHHVVFDPDTRGRLYTFDAISDDGGVTWREMGPGEAAERDAVMSTAAVVPEGVSIDGVITAPPGRVRSLSRALDGTVYAHVVEANRFPIWFTPSASDPWRPVGGAGDFVAMAAGEPGVLYVAGRQLGGWRNGAWTRTDWPDQFEPASIRAHPRAPLVVVQSRDGHIVVSRDGGRTLRRLRFEREFLWLALDPFQAEHILLMDRSHAFFALELGRLR